MRFGAKATTLFFAMLILSFPRGGDDHLEIETIPSPVDAEARGPAVTISASWCGFVLEQLGAVGPVTARRMFGGVGLYSQGLFFALMNDDTLYFKVDASNQPDFEARGMGAFHPFGDDRAMGYFEVPSEVLEDTDELAIWMGKALKVASSKPRKKKTR